MARIVRVEGIRKEANDLVEDLKSVVSSIYEIRDDIGAKKANIYFYKKEIQDNGDDIITWEQVLPSPNIVDLSQNLDLKEGGILGDQELFLKGIPINDFNATDLETDTDNPNVIKYWVIRESNITRAFTTVSIKRNLLSYTVHIIRYSSINDNELVIDQ